MEEFNRILDVLASRGIKYTWIRDRSMRSMYRIYVHKRDMEEARYLIRK